MVNKIEGIRGRREKWKRMKDGIENMIGQRTGTENGREKGREKGRERMRKYAVAEVENSFHLPSRAAAITLPPPIPAHLDNQYLLNVNQYIPYDAHMH